MSHPPVPLPSIRDIFPGASFLSSSCPRPHPASEMSIRQPSSQVRRAPSALRPRPTHPQHTPSRTRDVHHHQPPPSPPSSSSSESAVRPQPVSPGNKQPGYSFNVLRADPITSSLEHVASSTTLRPRASSAAAHPGMHGAAPVFRVAIAPGEHRTRHRPPRPVREILPDTRDRHAPLAPSIPREADLAHLRSPSSTILSFPVSDHPVSAPSALVSPDGRRVYARSEIPGAALQGEGRGKKHQCPHCGKRFNRPSSMKIHVNTHTGAKRTWRCFFYTFISSCNVSVALPPSAIPFLASSMLLSVLIIFPTAYRCPFPGCGREFNVNSNMRRHWRNHSRSAPARLPDPDVGRGGPYHPHHPRLDGLQHHALMSPPATNSSVSEGNSDDECYSDEEADVYPMDVDDGEPRSRREADDEGMDGVVCDASPPPTMKGSAGSSSSSDWSRSASPARAPAPAYGHGGTPLHRHAHPQQDQQARHPPHSHAHAHGHAHTQSEYIYRPSIAAYAISCTDSRVSTALRPAFTSNSSCPVRDRERGDRDRYHTRPATREKRHGQAYPS